MAHDKRSTACGKNSGRTEASLRTDFKADIQAAENRLRAEISELRADTRALGEKLDRVLESLLQP